MNTKLCFDINCVCFFEQIRLRQLGSDILNQRNRCFFSLQEAYGFRCSCERCLVEEVGNDAVGNGPFNRCFELLVATPWHPISFAARENVWHLWRHIVGWLIPMLFVGCLGGGGKNIKLLAWQPMLTSPDSTCRTSRAEARKSHLKKGESGACDLAWHAS